MEGRLMFLGDFGWGKGEGMGGGLRLGSLARRPVGVGWRSSRHSLWVGIVGSTLVVLVCFT